MKHYQTYGVDAQGLITHAGPHWARSMTMKVAYHLQSSWERWRARYIREHPGTYPLQDVPATVALHMHPIDDPSNWVSFPMPIADARKDGES